MVNLNNMVIAMKELKFDESEPVIYDIVSEIEQENKGALSYEDFVDKLTEKLQDRDSEKATGRFFDLFVEDPKGTITFEVLKKVAAETGDNASDEDLRRLIKSGASNGNDIPYEEFHSIMTKDVSLK